MAWFKPAGWAIGNFFRKHFLFLFGFMALYFLIICMFAKIYEGMPGQFYHATVQYEESMQVERRLILSELRDAMIKSYRDNYKSDILKNEGAKDDDWTANVTDLRLDGLRYDGDTVSFSIRLPHKPELTRGDFDLIGPDPFDPLVKISVGDYRGWLKEAEGKRPDEPVRLPVEFKAKESNRPMERLISMKTRGGKVITGAMLVPISVRSRMAGYIGAMNGFPGYASGSFERMFYLNTVTITTLGYGDILPITTRARNLIALEAILGTLYVGIFLWALTERIKSGLQPQAPSAGQGTSTPQPSS